MKGELTYEKWLKLTDQESAEIQSEAKKSWELVKSGFAGTLPAGGDYVRIVDRRLFPEAVPLDVNGKRI